MIADSIAIRPIRAEEWLPDRCLTITGPFDPKCYLPESGCPGLNYSQKGNRENLEQVYRSAIDKYGSCGYVAWDNDKIVAYHNFFPFEVAHKMRFYGSGSGSCPSDRTLIHNCLTIVKGDYLRNGISSRLVKESLNWAGANHWKRFEVHLVLLDCDKGWQSDQKSCLSFWEKFGFEKFKEYDADETTKKFYGVTKRYSLYLSLKN